MPNGSWCMLGARMGTQFGRRWARTPRLRAINDMGLLKTIFEKVQAQHGSPA